MAPGPEVGWSRAWRLPAAESKVREVAVGHPEGGPLELQALVVVLVQVDQDLVDLEGVRDHLGDVLYHVGQGRAGAPSLGDPVEHGQLLAVLDHQVGDVGVQDDGADDVGVAQGQQGREADDLGGVGQHHDERVDDELERAGDQGSLHAEISAGDEGQDAEHQVEVGLYAPRRHDHQEYGREIDGGHQVAQTDPGRRRHPARSRR